MFDRYLIVAGSLRPARTDSGRPAFAFEARCGYYRRLILSMVEELQITLDGVRMPRAAIRTTVQGRTFSMDEMETEYHLAWEFGEPMTVTVELDEALAPGVHGIELVERLRISYNDQIQVRSCSRIEFIGEPALA